MFGKEEVYKKIREYYELANHYLNTDNHVMAHNTLYKDMPVDLYDISVNLWADRNTDQDKERADLIRLIEEVDIKLNPEEHDSIDN
jgi:hypothetical protein